MIQFSYINTECIAGLEPLSFTPPQKKKDTVARVESEMEKIKLKSAYRLIVCSSGNGVAHTYAST